METFLDYLPAILGCLIAALAGVFNYLTARRTGKTYTVISDYLPKVASNTDPTPKKEERLYVVLPDGSKVDLAKVSIVKGEKDETQQSQ